MVPHTVPLEIHLFIRFGFQMMNFGLCFEILVFTDQLKTKTTQEEIIMIC